MKDVLNRLYENRYIIGIAIFCFAFFRYEGLYQITPKASTAGRVVYIERHGNKRSRGSIYVGYEVNGKVYMVSEQMRPLSNQTQLGEEFFVTYSVVFSDLARIDFSKPIVSNDRPVVEKMIASTACSCDGEYFSFSYEVNGRKYERAQRRATEFVPADSIRILYFSEQPEIAYACPDSLNCWRRVPGDLNQP